MSWSQKKGKSYISKKKRKKEEKLQTCYNYITYNSSYNSFTSCFSPISSKSQQGIGQQMDRIKIDRNSTRSYFTWTYK